MALHLSPLVLTIFFFDVAPCIGETKLKINRITSNYEDFTQGNKLSTKQKDQL